MTLIAVTGANGFVGREALRALLGAGHAVRACVRDPGRLAAAGVVHDRAGVETVRVADCDWGAGIAGAEVVLHIAGRAHVNPGSAAGRALMRAVNVDATESLALTAHALGVKRFVFVSSIGVHGSHTVATTFAATDTPAPVDFYAQTKWQAEQRLRAVCAGPGMELVVVRPTLVAGAGAPGNLERLARLIRRGLPVPVVSGDARRHLVGVRSLAQLLCLACTHPAAADQVLLAADDPPFSAAEMAAAIAKGMGKRARLVRLPMVLLGPIAALAGRGRDLTRIGSPLLVDAAPARAALGWRAAVTVQEELEALGRAACSASSPRK